MLTRQIIIIVLVIIIMGGARFLNRHGSNSKKQRHHRKPPVRGKRSIEGGIEVEDMSIDCVSQVVVEDASIDADIDDTDSCFGVCLASNENYDGPIDCSLAGSDNAPIVDCSFLQRNQGIDVMDCDESVGGDIVEDGSDGLVDTESEDDEWLPGNDTESEDDEWLPGDDSSVGPDMDDSDDISNSNNRFAFVFSNDCCNNCRRERTRSNDVQYKVELRETRVRQRRFRRRFSNYSWAEVVSVVEASGNGSRVHGEVVRLKLCQHC